MNKQAFTFLTLFTLVLMLAVYYVTLPLDNPSVMSDDLIVSIENDDLIPTLKNELEEKHNDNIEQYEKEVSTGSSYNEKLDALDAIQKQQDILNLEISLQESFEEDNYSGCLIEIETDVTRVMCPNDYNTKEDALNLMNIVYGSVDPKMLVEVSFD